MRNKLKNEGKCDYAGKCRTIRKNAEHVYFQRWGNPNLRLNWHIYAETQRINVQECVYEKICGKCGEMQAA